MSVKEKNMKTFENEIKILTFGICGQSASFYAIRNYRKEIWGDLIKWIRFARKIEEKFGF